MRTESLPATKVINESENEYRNQNETETEIAISDKHMNPVLMCMGSAVKRHSESKRKKQAQSSVVESEKKKFCCSIRISSS